MSKFQSAETCVFSEGLLLIGPHVEDYEISCLSMRKKVRSENAEALFRVQVSPHSPHEILATPSAILHSITAIQLNQRKY